MSIRLEVGTEVKKQLDEQPRPEHVPLQQRFEERFQLAFAEAYRMRDQGADVPRVFVEMFFSDHQTREGLRGLRRKIRKDSLNVYAPEAFGWRQEDLKLFTEASYGEIISPEELHKRLKKYSRPGFRKNVEDTYYSHIPIMIIDVPSRRSLKKESDKAWHYEPPLDGDFSEALNYTRTLLNSVATRQNEREDYMLSQITPEKIEKLLKTYPGLVGDKNEINILLSLGRAHAPMPSDYSNHSFTNEGIIRNKFGRPVNDELAASIFLEYFIDKYLSSPYGSSPSYWLTNDSEKLDRFKRIFVGQMNMQDAERIFNHVNRGVEKWGTALFPAEELESLFKDKGLHIPEPKKLDEYLNNPIPAQPKNA